EEGNSRLQGTAIARADGALELRRQQGVLWRLLLHEPGSAAAALGQYACDQPWIVGGASDGRNGKLQSPGWIEDRGRNDAAGAQPRHFGARQGSVWPACSPGHVFLVRQ